MLATLRPAYVSDRVPPHVFFLVSAVSRYLGPAFAVLRFARAECARPGDVDCADACHPRWNHRRMASP